ncbi:MAG TPA: hypothetical protein VK629_07475 [Steroidobacteraceae bacterium]|nr:hypothetical protein [Steroidobacteraceae bacterium]
MASRKVATVSMPDSMSWQEWGKACDWLQALIDDKKANPGVSNLVATAKMKLTVGDRSLTVEVSAYKYVRVEFTGHLDDMLAVRALKQAMATALRTKHQGLERRDADRWHYSFVRRSAGGDIGKLTVCCSDSAANAMRKVGGVAECVVAMMRSGLQVDRPPASPAVAKRGHLQLVWVNPAL